MSVEWEIIHIVGMASLEYIFYLLNFKEEKKWEEGVLTKTYSSLKFMDVLLSS